MDSHVSREAVIEAISDELDKIDHVPQWVYDRLINRIKMLESAESREFEWCTDCKEYDKEKHCCHRYSKVIRQAVEEMKLVHCIDCQHSEYDEVYKDRYCHYNGKAEVVDDYHYCRDGEKKDDEVTCDNCDYSEKYVDGLILCRRTKTSHRVSATSTCGKGKRGGEDAETKV